MGGEQSPARGSQRLCISDTATPWARLILAFSQQAKRAIKKEAGTIFNMATLSLNDVDNRVQGRLALVTGAR